MITERVELGAQYQDKWSAVYLPAREPGQTDPTRCDFVSEADALDFVYSRMCRDCREGRQRILDDTSNPDNEDHQFDSLWPGCACEWEVLPTQTYAQCEGFNDIMDAVGAKVIWSKNDTQTD